MAKDDKSAGGRDPNAKKALTKAHADVHESLEAMQAQVQKLDGLLADALKNSAEMRKCLAGDDQKEQERRWKILSDTQERIFKIQQDVTMNKAKVADKAFLVMDGYVRD